MNFNNLHSPLPWLIIHKLANNGQSLLSVIKNKKMNELVKVLKLKY